MCIQASDALAFPMGKTANVSAFPPSPLGLEVGIRAGKGQGSQRSWQQPRNKRALVERRCEAWRWDWEGERGRENQTSRVVLRDTRHKKQSGWNCWTIKKKSKELTCTILKYLTRLNREMKRYSSNTNGTGTFVLFCFF